MYIYIYIYIYTNTYICIRLAGRCSRKRGGVFRPISHLEERYKDRNRFFTLPMNGQICACR